MTVDRATVRQVGRGPSRLDPVAPDWLVRILAPKKAPVPWADMIRTALTIVIPLALGLALGQLALGTFAGMGALAGALADRGGSRADRATRTAVAIGFGVVGLVAGQLTRGDGIAPVIVIAVAAAVSALLSAASATLSFGGLQLLVYTAVAGGLPTVVPLGQMTAAFVVGGAWSLATSQLQATVVGTPDPARDAVVAVLRDLADLLRGPGDVGAARQQLTTDISAAYDQITSARAVSSGRRADLQQLSSVLTAMSPLVSAVVGYVADGAQAHDLATAVDVLADAVARDAHDVHVAVGDEPDDDASVTASRPFLRQAVVRGLELTTGAVRGKQEDAPATETRRRPTPVQFLLGARTWTFVVRLTLTMTAAEIVRQLVPIERPYWILLTAALVLKPDLGSVFARGVQRTLGTLVGVVIGAAVLRLVPDRGWVLVAMLVFAALGPYGLKRNYGLFATFLTPLVLLLIDLPQPVGSDVIVSRIADTAIGAGVVLVIGYLLWPTTWRPRLGHTVAGGVDCLAAFVRAAFGDDRAAMGQARRRAYRALSDVRTALQVSLSEPPPVSTSAAAWWPLVVQLERAADAVTRAMVVGRQPHRAPDRHDVDEVAGAVGDLASALREHRPPSTSPLPQAGLLQPVAALVTGARDIVSGAAEGRSRRRSRSRQRRDRWSVRDQRNAAGERGGNARRNPSAGRHPGGRPAPGGRR